MARQMFPGEDPLGRRLLLYGRPREIVGLVGSVRHHGFSRDARPEMILPYRQFQLGGMTLVVRSGLEPRVPDFTLVVSFEPRAAPSFDRLRTSEY